MADTDHGEDVKQVSAEGPREVVTDKGYHSRAGVSKLTEWGMRTYCSNLIADGKNGKSTDEQAAVYANRRRIREGTRRRLLRQRGEKLERWNHPCCDRGGMRQRLHLRGRENILKRLVVHSGAANLERRLLMRKLFRKGNARGLRGRCRRLFFRCRTRLPRSDGTDIDRQ